MEQSIQKEILLKSFKKKYNIFYNEIKESSEFTSSDLDEEIKMSTKAMSRKRRHELLFGDTNTSNKNIKLEVRPAASGVC